MLNTKKRNQTNEKSSSLITLDSATNFFDFDCSQLSVEQLH